MPEAFSNLAAWQIVKKVTGYRLQASGLRLSGTGTFKDSRDSFN
jgi:hypothetical protein